MNLNDLGYSIGGQNKHNRENILVQPQLRLHLANSLQGLKNEIEK